MPFPSSGIAPGSGEEMCPGAAPQRGSWGGGWGSVTPCITHTHARSPQDHNSLGEGVEGIPTTLCSLRATFQGHG